MKKKLLLIIPAVIILIVSITVVLTKKSDNPKQVFQDNKIEETSKKKETKIIEESKQETVKEKKEEVQPVVEPKKEEVKTEQKQSTNNEIKNTTPTQSKEQPKQESVPVAPVQQPVQEQPKQQTEWEKLGISEYDYYHKPMWSWARVDYKIEDYGSFDATHNACITAGDQMEDIISYSCTNINSYSGDYLGDMLRVKY